MEIKQVWWNSNRQLFQSVVTFELNMVGDQISLVGFAWTSHCDVPEFKPPTLGLIDFTGKTWLYCPCELGMGYYGKPIHLTAWFWFFLSYHGWEGGLGINHTCSVSRTCWPPVPWLAHACATQATFKHCKLPQVVWLNY